MLIGTINNPDHVNHLTELKFKDWDDADRWLFSIITNLS